MLMNIIWCSPLRLLTHCLSKPFNKLLSRRSRLSGTLLRCTRANTKSIWKITGAQKQWWRQVINGGILHTVEFSLFPQRPLYLNSIEGQFDDGDIRLFNGLKTTTLSVTCNGDKHVTSLAHSESLRDSPVCLWRPRELSAFERRRWRSLSSPGNRVRHRGHRYQLLSGQHRFIWEESLSSPCSGRSRCVTLDYNI